MIFAVVSEEKRKINKFFPDITVLYDLKLALQTNEINRLNAINQSYRIIYTFDLRQTLPKYLRTFLHKNEVLMVGLTDQSYYSICHIMVRLLIF